MILISTTAYRDQAGPEILGEVTSPSKKNREKFYDSSSIKMPLHTRIHIIMYNIYPKYLDIIFLL